MANAKADDNGLDAEYIKIVEEAAKNDENLDISNCTLEHAVFLSQKLISKSENNINILTGEFSSPYYDKVRDEFEKAATRFQPIGKKIKIIILDNDAPENDDFNKLRERFREVIEVKNATIPSGKEVHHFLVSDSKRYRFEDPHTKEELSKQEVSAVANFNNANVASILDSEFKKLWERLQ